MAQETNVEKSNIRH